MIPFLERSLVAMLVASGITFSTMSLPASAASEANPLSVHVLDLQSGQPSPGIAVDLERRTAAGWIKLSSAVTDGQGRIRALWPAGKPFESGVYRVVFQTGAFYNKRQQPHFFPEIPVHFQVDASQAHYHIPLLLSPFGYSTYRGN
jgi:5-hydroxyisourate hydrolase